MSVVFHRTTGKYKLLAHTPDYDPDEWIIFDRSRIDELKALEGVPWKYRKVSGDNLIEMSQAEKDKVDSAVVAARTPKPLPEFADNTVALAKGLKVGQQYRTGDNLKIVH